VVLVVALVVAAAVGVVDAWIYVPPTHGTRAAVQRAIIAYELVPSPVWPKGRPISDRFSTSERAALQAAYVGRLAACSMGDALREYSSMDYAHALLNSRRRSGGTVIVAARGDIVYYDFISRRPNGDLIVHAAVRHVFTVGQWDKRRRRLTGRTVSAVPKAVIMEFTMHKAGSAWKVTQAVGWRFLSLPTGRISEEP
jgi:hypothetical protein